MEDSIEDPGSVQIPDSADQSLAQSQETSQNIEFQNSTNNSDVSINNKKFDFI